jgi:hypothetical protein
MEKARTGDLELEPDAYDDPDRDRDPVRPVTGRYLSDRPQDPEATS